MPCSGTGRPERRQQGPPQPVSRPEQVAVGLARLVRGDGERRHGERDEQRVTEPLRAQQRQHLLVEDRLALLVREVERPEPGGRVELDLAADTPAGPLPMMT